MEVSYGTAPQNPMALEDHCRHLADLGELINDEIKHAIKLLVISGEMTDKENEMVAASFAAGISQLAMLRLPLIVEASRLEQEAAGFNSERLV